MLPNFLILGTAKAATTWLAKCLSEHPDVFIPKAKEIYFFTSHFEKGLVWYESFFSDWSGQKAVGEATPAYIGRPEAPGRIRTTLGTEVKLIASLRHPVDRAYSSFWMHLTRGRLPPDADFREVFYQGFSIYDLRAVGFYFTQLSRYLKYFPRENLLVLVYEEVKRDAQTAVANCFEFLDVDMQFVPDALTTRVNKGVNLSVFQCPAVWLRRILKPLPRSIEEPLAATGRRILGRLPMRKRYEPLAQDLRRELLNDYMDDIKQLEGLLGRDLSIWYEPSRASVNG